MENLFAYGTLMWGDIMREVSGCLPVCVPATLEGFSRRCVKGTHYPALVQDKEGRVEGVIYLDVPDSAWDRLDRYEGEMYERQRVKIDLKEGLTLPAATYVARPEFLEYLEPYNWNASDFH